MKIDKPIWHKMNNLRQLNSLLHSDDPLVDRKRTQRLIDDLRLELSNELYPFIKEITNLNLLGIMVSDSDGKLIPNHSFVSYAVDSANHHFGGNQIFLEASKAVACSLPRHKPGKEPFLYAWDNRKLCRGKVIRRITALTSKLMKVAYVHKDNVRLTLTAFTRGTKRDVQVDFLQNNYVPWVVPEEYKEDGVQSTCSFVKSGKTIGWAYDVFPANRINNVAYVDNLIYLLCQWHDAQMTKIGEKLKYVDLP